METDVATVLSLSLGRAFEEKNEEETKVHREERDKREVLLREQVAALEEANVDLQQQLAWCESEMRVQQETLERLQKQEGNGGNGGNGGGGGGGGGPQQKETSDDIVRRLRTGATFIKHTRRGSPHPRVVWVDNKMENICWRCVGASNFKKIKKIRVDSVREIILGKKIYCF